MKRHHAAEALRALCLSGLHPDVLVPAFLEALHAVVPSYRNLFDWTDAHGRLVRYYTLPAFAAAMRSYEPAEPETTYIPTPQQLETLLMAMLRERALPTKRTPRRGAPTSQLIRTTPAGRFVATGALLNATHGTGQPLAQVSLQRFEPHRVALARALRALPLSPTQMAVCCDLYLGYTHTEIGQRMGLAVSTVTSHVRHAHDKLDVRSAIALRAALDAQIYPNFQQDHACTA